MNKCNHDWILATNGYTCRKCLVWRGEEEHRGDNPDKCPICQSKSKELPYMPGMELKIEPKEGFVGNCEKHNQDIRKCDECFEPKETLEPHKTQDEYCCACEYDLTVFEGKLKEQKATIKKELGEWVKYRMETFLWDKELSISENRNKLRDQVLQLIINEE